MFSATFGTGVQHLAADFLDAYTFVAVGRVGSAAQTVQQRLLWVEDSWDGWGPRVMGSQHGFKHGGIYMIL
jgi:superfamily II DNA/RNA helicase